MATRLVAEAKWLDSVADDERATAARLNELSTANAILHDLKLEGQQGNIDHLVIGPGGAFVVLTRRFTEPLVNRGGMLFAGERSLKPEIDGAKAVATRLGEVIGVSAVPIIGFHGGILSTAAPQQVEGVYVCAVENLVRVIVRAAYTQLAPHKITEVSERALTLVFNAGSVPRTQAPSSSGPITGQTPAIAPWIPDAGAVAIPKLPEQEALQQETMSILRQATVAGTAAATVAAAMAPAAGAAAAPAPAPTPEPAAPAQSLFQPMQPMQPIQAVQPAQPLQPFNPDAIDNRAAAFAPTSLDELSRMATTAGQGPEAAPPATTKTKADKPKRAPKAKPTGDPSRSRGGMIAIVLSLCVVAATAGAAVAIMQNGGDDTDGAAVATTLSTEVTGSTGVTVTTVAGPLAAAVAAPPVSFSAVCPSAGAGWSWVADWPGDLAGLTQYDVEYQNPDGSWTAVAPLTSSAVTTMSVAGQPPSSTLTFRITAVMQDASRSVNQAVAFTTPVTPC